jgi:hypothetical protein
MTLAALCQAEGLGVSVAAQRNLAVMCALGLATAEGLGATLRLSAATILGLVPLAGSLVSGATLAGERNTEIALDSSSVSGVLLAGGVK